MGAERDWVLVGMRQNVQPAVELIEVSPRDGLQNLARTLGVAQRLALIERCVAAGARRLEVVSFVNPRRVPQMADAEAVVEGLPDRSDVSYIGLCLNEAGVRRAVATRAGGRRGVDEAGCVVVASDELGRRNQGQTVAEGVACAITMLRLARAEGLVPQVTIGAALGCPFEGDVPVSRVVDMACRLADAAPAELALADTIGVGVPSQVRDLVGAIRDAVGSDIPLRLHLHDTRNTAIANIQAGWQAGVARFDASLGGLGGCPFAPGAGGNVALEDVVHLFQRQGVSCGLGLDAAIAAARWARDELELPVASRLAIAGHWCASSDPSVGR